MLNKSDEKGHILILFLILEEILSANGCRFFPFITLSILCHSLLACRISAEKSADNLIWVPLSVICCFPLVAFNIFSLFLILFSLINIRLEVFFLGFILHGICCAFWIGVSDSFPKLGKFSVLSLFVPLIQDCFGYLGFCGFI